ncbi:PQQ-binding-like beta-propeller repeat protein [Streptomyces sp. NPDC059166]|uniref:outer membrane protein assembly factor BamB family protein n=1 Tax=Streptomyces sp. NPDC059166 TaxID=3346752 RepID=UPI00368608AB
MEALRQDDPRRFGPYTVLARFGASASAVHYLARDVSARDSSGTDSLAVVTVARPGLADVPAFRRRFLSEARTAERLAGGWVQPPLVPVTDETLWTVSEYVPAVTLTEAIGLAGPLPERAVRIIGAGLAETLSRVHATGAVLQGLAPGTVLLAGDGPRLTAFGPLGAAASAEVRAGGQLSVRLGYLTPEQIGGEEAGPASDLFVLGLLLAYAATGTTPLADGPPEEAAERIAHRPAELDSVPAELRQLIADCLAKAPEDRPTAGSVAAELALEGAAGLAKGGWLPATLSAALRDQASRARASEVPADPVQDVEDGGPTDARPDGREPEDPTPGDATPTDATPHHTTPEDAKPDDATPADAKPDDATPADATPEGGTASDAVPPGYTPSSKAAPSNSPYGTGQETTGDGPEDSGTTRFLGTGARPPQTDRATTQLALPREAAGIATGPQAVAALPPAGSQPPALPPATPVPSAPAPAPAPAQPYPYAYPAAAPQGPAAPASPPSAPPAASGPAPGRRAVITAVAAGVAGLVLGGTAVSVLGSDEPASAADDKPAAEPGPTLPGRAPDPRWIHTRPAGSPVPATAGIWRNRLLVLTDTAGATALDLRTGRKLWDRADAAGAQTVLAAGDDLCFLASPTEFLWLSPKDGRIEHRVRFVDQFTDVPNMKVAPLTGLSGSVLWFTGSHTVTVKAPKPKKGKKPGKDTQVAKAYLFAYDIVRREELWRTAIPAGRAPGTPAYRLTAVRDADFVVRQTADTLTPADVTAGKGKAVFRCFDRATGKQLWSRQFGTVTLGGGAAGDEEGRLFGAVGDDLQAFETGTGKPVWTLNGTASSVFGTPLPAGSLLHTTNRNQEVGAVERATGKPVWRRSTEVPLGGGTPALTLGGSGKTLFASDASQVTAFAAADGRRLWKFQDIGVQDPEGATVTAPYRVLPAEKAVVIQRGGVFYSLPAE